MNRSTFPTAIDTFVEHVEVSPSDALDISRWKTLKAIENKTDVELSEYNTLTAKLAHKIFSAEDLNKLQDVCVALESFFRDETVGYLDDFQSKFTHRGIFDPSIQYYCWNNVTFDGEAYTCLKDCLGVYPDKTKDTEYWAKIALKGKDGQNIEMSVYTNTVSVTEATSSVSIGIDEYAAGDALLVYVDGVLLSNNDYTVVDGNVVKSTGAFNASEVIDFVVMKNVLAEGVYRRNRIENVVISSNDWIDDTANSGYFKYRYENTEITPNVLVDVYFSDVASINAANRFGVLKITQEGLYYVDIFSVIKPLLDMNAEVVIWR